MKSETEIKETNHIKISDTDSLFIGLRPVLEHMKSQGIEINDTNKNEIILKLANQIQEESNANLNTISKNLFNIKPDTHYFQLKQEVIARSLLTTGKRRYGMYITNKEGVVVEELDLKGLEIMKSNINPIFKEFGTKFIKDILFDKPKSELDKAIIDLYKSLKTIDSRILGKPTGVKNINIYIKRKPTSGSIFSELITGTPYNSRAAVNYNDILKFKQLDKKYESILEGDKIAVINLKNNPYHIETIGLPHGSKIPPDIEKFVNDYIDVESIFESSILGKLKELYKDLGWEFVCLNEKISKYFLF